MSGWALFVNVAGVVFMALLAQTLRWTSIERGRAHREWARLQRVPGRAVVPPTDWCMAMAAAAGCA